MDKNKRIYGGVDPSAGEVWPRAYGRSALAAELRGQSTPPCQGAMSF